MSAMPDQTERSNALKADLADCGVSDVGELLAALHSQIRVDRVRRHYSDIFARMEGESWFVFMNHGYAPSEAELERFPELASEDDAWRHQVFLYFHLLDSAISVSNARAVRGADLLDVGCGRGGGLSAMRRYYGLRRAVGVDLHPQQIRFCIDRHRDIELEFVEGDALALPFASETFDVVSNVESSHCYGDMPAFFRQVSRVLRGGGLFLFADQRETTFGVPLLEVELVSSGLELLCKRTITRNVQRACVLDAARFSDVFRSSKACFPKKIAEIKKLEYSSGATSYLACILRKS